MFRRAASLLAALLLGVVAATVAPMSASAADNGKVIVIVVENHSLAQMQASMPYTFGLAKSYEWFDNYTAITHPSEPNYLAIAGGSTFGDTGDHNPAFQVSGQSVFGQAVSAGGTAGTYAESMTSNCKQSDTGDYAVKHNPWASFRDERTACNTSNVPMGTTTAGNLRSNIDSGSLPTVAMMVPNLCNDAHDCSLGTADSWIHNWMNVILAGPDYQAGRLTVVVTADEDDRNSGNKVLTLVVNPRTAGRGVNHTSLNHFSLGGFMSDATGSPHLRGAVDAPNMSQALGYPTPK